MSLLPVTMDHEVIIFCVYPAPCLLSPQSKASDMRFDGIFEDKEAIQQSKRQRVINSRYRGDYVEPVIYRAIME